MDNKKIIEIVEKLARPIAESFGLEVVDVQFVKENNEWFLRVFIDKEEGITIDDCTNVSRRLSDKLDEIDPISVSYYLEVSSPGINRPLKNDKDFKRFINHNIKIKLFEAINGKKVLKGLLEDYRDGKILLNVDGEKIEIERNKISLANLND
ncbi:Ribosome maturation factor RimP [Caloramator mitchellensis]|uniref:Ribosome maturation factor RimP n=1 Tax=Caloramator mitchellensis TaxID=908809 RepID=A0A0R3JTY5_CALMK|nr:ribosome maturation factor RimP [Caloramator mitchellensis]KRQ86987.1 Ribosome maturation factor RimP [Caloramator mitchellensis]